MKHRNTKPRFYHFVTLYTRLFAFLIPGIINANDLDKFPPETLNGLRAQYYLTGKGYDKLMSVVEGELPNKIAILPNVNLDNTWHPAFTGFADNFILHLTGLIYIPQSGKYTFRLRSDDGSRLWIDDKPIVDNDGAHGDIVIDNYVRLSAGYHRLKVEYFQVGWFKHLILEWKKPRDNTFSVIPASAFTHTKAANQTSPGNKKVIEPGQELKEDDIDNLPQGESAGLLVNIYKTEKLYSQIMRLVPGQTPNKAMIVHGLNFQYDTHPGFGGFGDNFILHAIGNINIAAGGKYKFKLTSDDGSRLMIDDKVVIDHDGTHGSTPKEGEVNLTPGKHSFKLEYFQGWFSKTLILEWIEPGESTYALVSPAVFTHKNAVLVVAPGNKSVIEAGASPGDGLPLAGVHPSYSLQTIRNNSFQPAVGGMDFLPNGKLVVSNVYDGKIYLVNGVLGNGPYTQKLIASNFNFPLGIKVVNGEIYVLERTRLVKLIDSNGDEVADQQQVISSGWGTTGNFHEFAFGLAYKDGFFYATLSIGIDFGGKSSQLQNSDRGKVLKIAMDGSYTLHAKGLRTPNGVNFGVDNQLFISDNQGDWLPANRINHFRPNGFYGNRDVDRAFSSSLTETPPLVYLPQNLIGNSPSQMVEVLSGPYKGQMFYGDVTYGGIQRIFVEKINKVYQGAVFRFTQGLEAGVNRLVWGPDGALYVGEVGGPGNWSQAGKLTYGLQKLKYNGKQTYDFKAVRALSNGFELEFTEPIHQSVGNNASFYKAEHWTYNPTSEYGGPNVNQTQLVINSVEVSRDRKKVVLRIGNLKKGYVVHLKVDKGVTNQAGAPLWNTEAWYTLNEIPATLYSASARLASSSERSASEEKSFSLSLYPNPADFSTTLELQSANEGNYRIRLFDLLGREKLFKQIKIHPGPSQAIPIDTQTFPAGIYIMEVSNQETGEVAKEKLVIEK
jgi:glucose/arabinose dehydrogenase